MKLTGNEQYDHGAEVNDVEASQIEESCRRYYRLYHTPQVRKDREGWSWETGGKKAAVPTLAGALSLAVGYAVAHNVDEVRLHVSPDVEAAVDELL